MTQNNSWNEVDPKQRYDFFHVMIPMFLHRSPQRALEKINAEGLEEAFVYCWHLLESSMDNPSQLDRLPIAIVQGPNTHPNGPWLLTFPASKVFPDLFAAVIVPEQENRYLTLEPFDDSNPEKGLVCEWREGEHLNYGPEEGIDVEEFASFLNDDSLRELGVASR